MRGSALAGRYYRRRVIRVVPAYYYALLLVFVLLLPLRSFLPAEARSVARKITCHVYDGNAAMRYYVNFP
jgi:peptidoglycan/LPS O-acetylase OafA/YrhL